MAKVIFSVEFLKGYTENKMPEQTKQTTKPIIDNLQKAA